MRPILLSAFGFRVASAPVLAGLAALAAFLHLRRRRPELDLDDDGFWTLTAFLAVGVFAGSLGFYALAYGGGLLANVAFWRDRRGIQGGSLLGVLLGAVSAAALFCRSRRRPFGPIGDALGQGAALGLVFMRVGCFLNGCCHGRPTDGPWGVVFTQPCAVPARLLGTPLYPTQLIEAAGALAIYVLIERFVRPRQASGRLRPGDALIAFLGLYGALRFGVDFLRGSDPGVVVPLGLTLAQWAGAGAAAAAAVRFREVRRR